MVPVVDVLVPARVVQDVRQVQVTVEPRHPLQLLHGVRCPAVREVELLQDRTEGVRRPLVPGLPVFVLHTDRHRLPTKPVGPY